MIEQIPKAPPGVLALKAVGEVDLDDYTRIVKPALDSAMSGGRKLRAVVLLGPEFTGYAKGIKREDLGIGLGFVRKVERCAVVTDKQGIRDLMRRFGWMLGKRLKQFGVADLQAAMDWAAGR